MSSTMETHIYIDASCNHQKGIAVVGQWCPSNDFVELIHLSGSVKSTSSEVAGFITFSQSWPQLDDHMYVVHTDCNNLMVHQHTTRDDITFIKEMGHGRVGVVNADFRKIDKLTRKAMRAIVKSPSEDPDTIIATIIAGKKIDQQC